MGLVGKFLTAMIGEKNVSAVRVGMFAGQAYELFREFQKTGQLPAGVKLMIDPEMLVGMVESHVKMNEMQRRALRETAERFNAEVNKRAEKYGRQKAAGKHKA